MEGGEAIFVNDTIIDLKYDPNTQEINGSNQLTTKAVNGTDGSVIKFWKGTQADYDAIQTKDGNTFYIIVN